MQIVDQKEVEKLNRFSEQARKLESEKYSSLGMSKTTFSVKVGERAKVLSKLPNEDTIKLFFVDFRFFWIKDKNDFNFEKICQFFIEKVFKTKEVQEWLGAYKSILNNEEIKLKVDNRELTTKMIFHTIMNAGTFHQEGSQKGIDIIKSNLLIESLAMGKFSTVLGKLRMIICNFNRQIVEEYLKEN